MQHKNDKIERTVSELNTAQASLLARNAENELLLKEIRFLRRDQKKNYTVKFQDVSETNSKLKKVNISYDDLRTASKKELADLLGVDAVISTNINMEKPMSEGAAVAIGVLVGAWGATNRANITINIHEHNKGDLMWKYDYQALGSVFNSIDQLVNALMRNATRKFPYNAQ